MSFRRDAQIPMNWVTEPPIERRRQLRIAYGVIRPENRVETRLNRRLRQQAMAKHLPPSANARCVPEIWPETAAGSLVDGTATRPTGGNFFDWERLFIKKLVDGKDSRFRRRPQTDHDI